MILVEGEDYLNLLERKKAQLEERLPEDLNFTEFFNDVSEYARQHGVLLPQLDPGPVIERDGYREMSVAISAMGDFRNFYDFLFALGSMPRLAKIDTMSIRPRDGIGRCDISLTVKIFAAEEG